MAIAAVQQRSLGATALRLIAAALQGSSLPTKPVQPYSQTANVTPGVHTRLLSEGGAVVLGLPLSEAFAQAPAAEEYASVPTSELVQRPEIDSALRGTPATAIRRVLENRRVLYAAAPVYAENGRISGIVYIATPLPSAGLPVKLILQLVGAVEALTGILMCGWSTGFFVAVVSRALESKDMAGARS